MQKVVHAYIHCFDICQGAYISTAQSTDQLNCFKEQFNFLPRVVLDYSARDHLTPEADVGLLRQRLKQMEHEMQNACSSLEQRERDYSVLQAQLRDLTNSRSWKVSAPLRALGGLLSVCKQCTSVYLVPFIIVSVSSCFSYLYFIVILASFTIFDVPLSYDLFWALISRLKCSFD